MIRILYNPDETIKTITVIPESRLVIVQTNREEEPEITTTQEMALRYELNYEFAETEAEHHERACGYATPEGVDYDDIDEATLPQDNKRKWRGRKGVGVWLDDTVITIKEKQTATELELDIELAKPNGNPLVIARLQNKLRKGIE